MSSELVQPMDSPLQSSVDAKSDISDLVAAEVARQMAGLKQGQSPMETAPVDGPQMATDAGEARESFPQNPRWYLKDGLIEVVAGDELFQVPRLSLQRGSSRFRELADDQVADLHDRKAPVHLPTSISAVDFERFLEVLYPIVFSTYSLETAEEWTSVLRVAHFLSFASLKSLAMEQLETKASPIEKIVYAREFDIDTWLHGAYADLCCRTDPLNGEEMRMLGYDAAAKIAATREGVRPKSKVARSVALNATKHAFWPNKDGAKLPNMEQIQDNEGADITADMFEEPAGEAQVDDGWGTGGRRGKKSKPSGLYAEIETPPPEEAERDPWELPAKAQKKKSKKTTLWDVPDMEE